MIVIVQEDEDGIFVPSQAVVADWFINIRQDGSISLSDSKGENKMECSSVDEAIILTRSIKSAVA